MYAPIYVGGYLRRLAIDLAIYLIYDIKAAFSALKVTTLLTKNVIGVFNVVYKFRLVK